MAIRIATLGATGKMGQRILKLAQQDPEFDITIAYARQKTLDVVTFTDPFAALSECDVGIDFTFHTATKEHLEAALRASKPMVIGTTGHSVEEIKEIEEASKSIPILYSPNFSFGIALCTDAVSRIAKALGTACTIDIVETHHIHKKDSPSGTAIALANAIEGKKIAIQSIRLGETIGEHTVIFECGHERIELKHTAHSRDAFAAGALIGAKFLLGQPAGLYSLKDLFNQTILQYPS